MKKTRAQTLTKERSARSKPPAAKRDVVGRAPTGDSVAERIPPEWTWHYRRLLELRERLLKDRGEQLEAAAKPLEPYSMDMADSATDEFTHDMALSQLSAEQDALYEVDQAISRILNGTYGVCEQTGQPIPVERLNALPWTRFARDVEAWLERKGVIGRPHLGTLGSVRGPAELAAALKETEAEAKGESSRRSTERKRGEEA